LIGSTVRIVIFMCRLLPWLLQRPLSLCAGLAVVVAVLRQESLTLQVDLIGSTVRIMIFMRAATFRSLIGVVRFPPLDGLTGAVLTVPRLAG
jgi:hypothetical protein